LVQKKRTGRVHSTGIYYPKKETVTTDEVMETSMPDLSKNDIIDYSQKVEITEKTKIYNRAGVGLFERVINMVIKMKWR